MMNDWIGKFLRAVGLLNDASAADAKDRQAHRAAKREADRARMMDEEDRRRALEDEIRRGGP